MAELKDGQVIPLPLLTRRTFCRMSLTGLGLAILPACGGDPLERVGTGLIEDPTSNLGGEPDLATPDPGNAGPGDMATRGATSRDMAPRGGPGAPDMATPMQMGSCPNGAADTGTAPGAIAVNTAVYVKARNAFLCHDGGGFFAISSRCTHNGVTLNGWSGSSFHCNRHGANFSYTGAVQNGPSGGPLDHYLLCTLANGNIGIATGTIVAAGQRYML